MNIYIYIHSYIRKDIWIFVSIFILMYTNTHMHQACSRYLPCTNRHHAPPTRTDSCLTQQTMLLDCLLYEEANNIDCVIQKSMTMSAVRRNKHCLMLCDTTDNACCVTRQSTPAVWHSSRCLLCDTITMSAAWRRKSVTQQSMPAV